MCYYRHDTQVLFTSSKWDNAEAICIGGNSEQYGPHEYAWYDDSMSYLFVSYDGGHSKAFLQCNSLLGAAAGTDHQAQLEVGDSSKTIGTTNAPVIVFHLNSNAFWSIDAWGFMETNSECQWYTDAVGFTSEMAVGKDFGQLALPGVKQDTDEGSALRGQWGGNAGDDKQAVTNSGADVLQPRGTNGGGTNGGGTNGGGAKSSKVRSFLTRCASYLATYKKRTCRLPFY